MSQDQILIIRNRNPFNAHIAFAILIEPPSSTVDCASDDGATRAIENPTKAAKTSLRIRLREVATV